MQKKYTNKLQKGEATKGEVVPFYFPKYNKSYFASSYQEALKMAEKDNAKDE